MLDFSCLLYLLHETNNTHSTFNFVEVYEILEFRHGTLNV